MRSICLLVLTLGIATTLAAALASQGAPPTKPVPPQPSPPPPVPPSPICYRQVDVEIPLDLQWAKILVGGKWITGCVGPAGGCVATIWVPC